MTTIVTDIGLADVQAVYSGPEGDLWELLMGEQIHVGGYASSLDLAEKAGIAPGMRGIDICCATGAGMRFLARARGVAHMTGIDATSRMVAKGRERTADEGLDGRVEFVLADVLEAGLPDGCADFVWGEDAWCYVTDKPRLIAEAVRMTRPGGTIVFTDWVVDLAILADNERERLLRFMKFPNIAALDDYRQLLEARGCRVLRAEDTHRFPPNLRFYLQLIETQFRYDALKRLGFDEAMVDAVSQEMRFMLRLAEEGKLFQGLFVAVR